MSRINIPDPLDANELQQDLSINPVDLNDGMMRQAALFAHYSRVAADAERLVGKIEQISDVIQARLDREIRDAATAAGEKRTEAQIKNMIAAHPKFIEVQSALNNARMNASIAKSAADAFRHRRDMLVQIAFNQREEFKGELRVNGHNPAAESVRTMAAHFRHQAAEAQKNRQE